MDSLKNILSIMLLFACLLLLYLLSSCSKKTTSLEKESVTIVSESDSAKWVKILNDSIFLYKSRYEAVKNSICNIDTVLRIDTVIIREKADGSQDTYKSTNTYKSHNKESNKEDVRVSMDSTSHYKNVIDSLTKVIQNLDSLSNVSNTETVVAKKAFNWKLNALILLCIVGFFLAKKWNIL